MRTILIKVERDDVSSGFTSITVGRGRFTRHCPIARALARKTGGDVTIGCNMAYYVDPETGVRMVAVLTPQARLFQQAFDKAVDMVDASLLPWPKTFRLTFW